MFVCALASTDVGVCVDLGLHIMETRDHRGGVTKAISTRCLCLYRMYLRQPIYNFVCIFVGVLCALL